MSPRRIVFGLLTAVAVAASGAALPASAAQASSTYIDVQYTPGGVSSSSSVGSVSVSIAATSPLTSLTVSVYTDAGGFGCTGTDVLDLAMSDFVQPGNDGNGAYGAWTLSTPITTSQLSLGYYQVCLTAADQGGDSVSAYVGPLYFLNIVQFPTFQASGTSFSYDNQDVTLSGDAVLLAPDGTTTPFGGKTLTVVGSDTSNPTTVTGSDGSFSVTFQVTASGPYWVSYSDDATTSGASTSVELTLTTFPVQITSSLAATQVNAGDPDSVSGTVTYTDNGATKPFADTTVGLYYTGYYVGAPPVATTLTDASGNFTLPVPTQQSQPYVLATAPTTYFQTGQTSQFSVTVAEPNEITNFQATLSRLAVVSVSGCITAGEGDVRVEYAAKPSGPWTTLGTSPAFTHFSCPQGETGGNEFSAHFAAKLAAAYYRVEYVATPDWQATVSNSVYLWKYLTKITSFSVTPRRVAGNGHVTVSGRLWTRSTSGKWRPYAHQLVLVIFRYRGTWYRYRREPTTNSAGWFSKSAKVYVSAPFAAVYLGNSTHFATGSNRIRVTTTGASLAAGVAQPWLVPMRGLWPEQAVAWGS